MLLALDCSSPERSVALWNGHRVVASRRHREARQAALVSLIDQTLTEAALSRKDVDTLAVGLGPGSYTGIRAAIAFAQGWELATGVRLLGISSVDVCAQQCLIQGLRGEVAVVIDAQRQECYLASFLIDERGVTPATPLRLATRAEARALADGAVTLAGPDLEAQGLSGARVFPDAAALAALASARTEAMAGDRLEPIYLRATSFTKAPPPRVIA